MGRGIKLCHCGAGNGPRALACKSCFKPFDIKSSKKDNTVEQKKKTIKVMLVHDWRTLQPGDYIKTVNGSGPYYKCQSGNVELMGYYGKFKVHEVQKDGLHCYPADYRNGGFSFVYMGEEKIGPCGVINIAHKIKKVNPKYINKV